VGNVTLMLTPKPYFEVRIKEYTD